MIETHFTSTPYGADVYAYYNNIESCNPPKKSYSLSLSVHDLEKSSLAVIVFVFFVNI